jgi:hypothetical protein
MDPVLREPTGMRDGCEPLWNVPLGPKARNSRLARGGTWNTFFITSRLLNATFGLVMKTGNCVAQGNCMWGVSHSCRGQALPAIRGRDALGRPYDAHMRLPCRVALRPLTRRACLA